MTANIIGNATTNAKNNWNIADHDGATTGLMLGGVLVTATAADLNRDKSSTRVVNVTGATLTITQALHDGKFLTLSRAAGIAVTLPAATGSGAEYKFFVDTTVTSNTTTIKVANTTDNMSAGKAVCVTATAAAVLGYNAGATDDTVTLNGTTTGGLKGDLITVRDLATGLFGVLVQTSTTGTTATPFSATV